jgi:lambda family phage portal protein
MAILDLVVSAPLEGYKSRGRRTLTPQNSSALLGGGPGATFAGARINRLTMDFLARTQSADAALFGSNIKLRARARELSVNNPFARKFLQMCAQNVVGPTGIMLQAKVRGVNGKKTAQADAINLRVEEEWLRWCRAGRCTADGRYSFAELQQMAIKNIAREGENILKMVYGRQFNDCGFALQPLDNDQLDDTLMTAVTDDITIRMGVEADKYLRPLAYHLWSGHPFDILPARSRIRVRVPASEIVHSAVWERPAQSRGYTWLAPAILAMNMHAGWGEASLVAARSAAAKFAVIETTAAEGYDFDEDEEGNDSNLDGTRVMTANAGEVQQLGPGQKLNFTDPRFPMNSFADFDKQILRSIASGLLVSYPSLANDLEGVNFSSIRAGLLDERDCWRVLQRWFIEHFCQPVFDAWLNMALLTTLSDITLSPAQREMFKWHPRGWDWVDPVKDADAAILRLGNGLTTYDRELANLGMDFEETIDRRAEEQEYIREKKGLILGTDLAGDQGGKGVAPDDEAAAAEVTAGKDGSGGSSDNAGDKKGSGKQ